MNIYLNFPMHSVGKEGNKKCPGANPTIVGAVNTTPRVA
jgi:hypothetical protein